MKKKYTINTGREVVEREINYIPVRYIIAMIITVFELVAMIGIVVAITIYVPYFYIALWITEIACVIKIVSSNDNPEYKSPWLLVTIVLPIVGFMLYFVFYQRKLSKKFVKRMQRVKTEFALKQDDTVFDSLAQQDLVACNQAKLICKVSDSVLFKNNKTTYFALGEDMHKAMLKDIEQAQKFILLEYFIIEQGIFWDSILHLLRQKARDGVDIKVIFDDIGCMSTLPGDYAKTLQSFGINATLFSKLKGNVDGEFNNRSHRKILVVDGKVGYTGGVNVADEYINQKQRFGHWKDVGVRMQGECVNGLTNLFLQDWGINVKKLDILDTQWYTRDDEHTKGYIIPFGDGPYPVYKYRVGKNVIQSMVAGATKSVVITTPYLIIDNDLCQCLENASLRGVEVKIIIPHVPDKKLVFELGKSYASRLMQSGVQIFEYTPGFIHAKTYLVDDKVAMVGTINLDYRSLVHHFENGVWMYDCDCIADIKKDMMAVLQQSEQKTTSDYNPNLLKRFVIAIARIFAPMF